MVHLFKYDRSGWYNGVMDPTVRKCILCDGTSHRVVFEEFGTPILRCRTCGHVFSSHKAEPHYDGYFGEEQLDPAKNFWWNEAHGKMYDGFSKIFLEGKTGNILDVGCGLGYFLKRVSSVPGWTPYGSEISKPAVDFAKIHLRLSNVYSGRLEDAPLHDIAFDVVTLWDVIEHLPEPYPLLDRIFHLLKPRGILFLHTPNVRVQLAKARLKRAIKGMDPSTHYLEAKDHVHLYSPRTLPLLLNRCGFFDVRFIHLPPIQSVSGSQNRLFKAAKNAWYQSAKTLDALSFGRLNIDNLFAVANKR